MCNVCDSSRGLFWRYFPFRCGPLPHHRGGFPPDSFCAKGIAQRKDTAFAKPSQMRKKNSGKFFTNRLQETKSPEMEVGWKESPPMSAASHLPLWCTCARKKILNVWSNLSRFEIKQPLRQSQRLQSRDDAAEPTETQIRIDSKLKNI